MRDRNRKLKDYRDTSRTTKIRSILEKVNDVNKSALIKFHDRTLNTFLISIFNRKFTLYGRLHTRGLYHYQGFSSEEREEITINGNKVVELDYSGLHPRLLYASIEIQFDDDPYSIVDDRPEVRPFLKILLLCMINGNQITAEKAANYWLYENHRQREMLNKLGITKTRNIMRRFDSVHRPISHLLCTGKDTGLKIMNKDSKIALDVLSHFANKGIPILAIHDSFIVEKRYKTELKNIMSNIYQNNTGGFMCKIK